MPEAHLFCEKCGKKVGPMYPLLIVKKIHGEYELQESDRYGEKRCGIVQYLAACNLGHAINICGEGRQIALMKMDVDIAQIIELYDHQGTPLPLP